jgi:hypothetical protein
MRAPTQGVLGSDAPIAHQTAQAAAATCTAASSTLVKRDRYEMVKWKGVWKREERGVRFACMRCLIEGVTSEEGIPFECESS